MKVRYMVAMQSVVTINGNHELTWEFDNKKFTDVERVKARGFTVRESDDFNIAILYGDTIIAMTWMLDIINHTKQELDEINKHYKG